MTKAQNAFAAVQSTTRRDGDTLYTVSWDCIGGRASDRRCPYDATGMARELVFNRFPNVQLHDSAGRLIAAGEAIRELRY